MPRVEEIQNLLYKYAGAITWGSKIQLSINRKEILCPKFYKPRKTTLILDYHTKRKKTCECEKSMS